MAEIAIVGLDLAKNVCQVHGVDKAGAVVLRRQLRQGQVEAIFASLPACLIGMEACASPHWARTSISQGHEVRLMPPAYVKAYVKRGKTDAADAEAIAEAVTRPTMRFVAVNIGCTAETLRRWVRQAERDSGTRPGVTNEDRERIRALERENRELRQANEILRKASAYFAQAELDRRFKP